MTAMKIVYLLGVALSIYVISPHYDDEVRSGRQWRWLVDLISVVFVLVWPLVVLAWIAKKLVGRLSS
jgi:hypothetical protein